MGNSLRKPLYGLNYVNLKTATKTKLNELFEEIIDTISIDYSNQEILDIQIAVRTILEKIVNRVNERGWFKISSIQPCGSMVEKTAVWKYSNWSKERYTELDFLAVLDYSPETKRNEISCGQCIEVSELNTSVREYKECDFLNVMNYSSHETKSDDRGCTKCVKASLRSTFTEDKGTQHKNENLHSELHRHRYWSDHLFWRELNTCLVSACQCFSAEYDQSLYRVSYKQSANCESNYSCDKCAVEMPSGILRVSESKSVGPAGVAKCSLAFLWTSKAKSLRACDNLLQEKAHHINSLAIHVDFLPALKLNSASLDRALCDHDLFIVPKKCNVCDRVGSRRKWRKWRKSNCMTEISFILNEMSEKHRKCYKIIKYILTRFMKFGINWYHVKTIALNHSTECSDVSEGCADCVLRMLTELKQAYETETVISFNDRDVNIFDSFNAALFRSSYTRDIRILRKIIERFCSVRSIDSCATLLRLEV